MQVERDQLQRERLHLAALDRHVHRRIAIARCAHRQLVVTHLEVERRAEHGLAVQHQRRVRGLHVHLDAPDVQRRALDQRLHVGALRLRQRLARVGQRGLQIVARLHVVLEFERGDAQPAQRARARTQCVRLLEQRAGLSEVAGIELRERRVDQALVVGAVRASLRRSCPRAARAAGARRSRGGGATRALRAAARPPVLCGLRVAGRDPLATEAMNSATVYRISTSCRLAPACAPLSSAGPE